MNDLSRPRTIREQGMRHHPKTIAASIARAGHLTWAGLRSMALRYWRWVTGHMDPLGAAYATAIAVSALIFIMMGFAGWL
jgi:hypothetical protein